MQYKNLLPQLTSAIRYKAVLLVLLISAQAMAQNTFLQRTTDVLSIAPTTTGLIKAILEKDKKGALQLGLSTATTLAINYGLEACIRKDRPDGDGHHAFPSTHTAVAFDGATFLMRRYGWKWGVPAYIVSTYVAWGRVYTKRHDIWDVLAGAAIGAGSAFIYTRKFVKDTDISIAPVAFGHSGCGVDVAVRF